MWLPNTTEAESDSRLAGDTGSWPNSKAARTAWLVVFDLASVSLGWILGFLFRFEGAIPGAFWRPWVTLLLPVNLAYLIFFTAFGLYRRLWRYAGEGDMVRLAAASGLATASVWLLAHYGLGGSYSRGAVLLSALVTLLFTVGHRFLIRLWMAGEGRPWVAGKRVLIVGAGEAGRMVTRELRRHPETGLLPVGFADDDPGKRWMYVAGLPVVAGREELEREVRERHVDEIIIAMPSASRKVTSEWIRLANRTGAHVRLVPGLYELINGQVDLASVRDIRPEDLLGREPINVQLDEAGERVRGETVLVSGAGGSIGSELCRQLNRLQPGILVLLGNEENQLHDLCVDLDLEHTRVPYELVLGNIRDEDRMNQVFSRFRPGIVFHAAAHKHVHILESNPEEAIKNNVLGTRNMALAALAAGTRTFVYVSTDKAVRPCSVMGASKRVGEMIVQSLNGQGPTTFVVVRFGNVLGSRGSVLPLFQKQVERGGPVTVTDPEATRYFMTVQEACQLLIQTVAVAKGGQVLVLDMGTPLNMLELAENVIRLAGKAPGDIPIEFTGLRPGERLHEELLTAYEEISATASERIHIASQRVVPWPLLSRDIDELVDRAAAGDGEAVKNGLFQLVVPAVHWQEATAE